MYLKLFLWTSIPFGTFMGVYVGILNHDLEKGIYSSLISGFPFGFFMSLIMGTFHKLKTKNISIGKYITPEQSVSFELIDSAEELFKKCIQVLNQMGAKITDQNKISGEIKASTSMSWKSFGELILIRMTENKNGKTEIYISSSPKLRTTLLDYGKGYENVDEIASFIKR